MEKLKNLHDVAAFYFFVLAFAYIAMVLSLRNGFLGDFMLSLMRIMDLPFAFVALLYGASTLTLQLRFDEEGRVKSSGWVLIITMICLVMFCVVAFMNFGMPTAI